MICYLMRNFSKGTERVMSEQNKTIIVGAGPAGIFCAYELLQLGYRGQIDIYERGKHIQDRHCPKTEVGHCVNCKLCSITSGVGGSGSFSDAKLSKSKDVGGTLPQLIGDQRAQDLIDYTDRIYLQFGADPTVEGLSQCAEVRELKRRAIAAGLKLVESPVRHLGTEKSRELYQRLTAHLVKNGVNFHTDTQVIDLLIEDEICRGIQVKIGQQPITEIHGHNIIVATGRKGAAWLEQMCFLHPINHAPSTVDIGVRVECRDEVMETINKYFYEGKFVGYPAPFKDKVRTFCQNPSGYVAQENYDGGLALVNGHAFKEQKSTNTNLSILVSHNFTTPFNQPLEYARKVGELTNMLADGHIMVQRYGDILSGKRTWQDELNRSNVKPTLPDAVAGDITAAMPYRAMTDIINFIQMLDKVVPGFAADETLLYSPEIKFYSNRIEMDKHLQTGVEGLYCLGDSSGWTRGLMMASAMGVQCAREMMGSENNELIRTTQRL